MNSKGISDSVAQIDPELRRCRVCGAEAQTGDGSCVGCLLHAALDDTFSSDSDAGADIEIGADEWRLGNYQILDEIGRGGMGVIYRARQRHSKRVVALKRVLSYHGDSSETLERFRREAQAVASLDHPNILPIYEVGEAEGLPFFTMKHATGGSLQQAAPALSAEPRECVRLLAKIVRAVAYAHREGILHRDLKPGNILLDARGEPMVSDFGLAKWIDGTIDLTRSLTIFGTPGYIAPEQAHGPAAALTPAADVYSLGAILFDLLTGRPPFLGEHALAVIRQAAEQAAPKLRSLLHQVDRDLETICSKCLEREPQLRYRAAADLAEDLERWLEGRPIVARPVSFPVRLWRFMRRNPVMAVAFAAAALAGGLGIKQQVESIRLTTNMREKEAEQRSVLVLPFLDLDTAHPDQSLSDATGRAFQASLGALGPARVTALDSPGNWISPQKSQDISLKVGARTVLAGTRRRIGDKVRVSLRLLDSGRGDVLFRTTLDVAPGDSIAIEIARLSTSAIQRVFLEKDWSIFRNRNADPALLQADARDFIATGRELLKTRTAIGLSRAAGCFQRATEAEPRSALALALLATAQAAMTRIEPAAGMLERAEASARKAIALTAEFGEGHAALANVLAAREDYRGSLDELWASIEIDGLMAGSAARLADILRALGRPDRALYWCQLSNTQGFPADVDNMIGDCWTDLVADDRGEAAYERMCQFRPELPDGWMGLCRLRFLQGKFGAAKVIAEEQLSRYPEFGLSKQLCAETLFFARDYSKAEVLYQALAKAEPDGGASGYDGLSYRSVLGALRLKAGDEVNARQILEQARAKEEAALQVAPHSVQALYCLAAIFAMLDDSDSSIDYLRRAIGEGWIDYRAAQLDPRFDRIAQDQRFTTLLRTVADEITNLRASALTTPNPEKP